MKDGQEEPDADIHDYEQKVRACIRRIENAQFAEEDKLLIKSYLKHMGAQGVSKGRVFKIAWTLLTLRRNMECKFREVDRGKISGSAGTFNDRGRAKPSGGTEPNNVTKDL